MSLSEKRDKSIVVELYQLLTPENQRGKSARKHEIGRAEKVFGPILNSSERSQTPVVSPDFLGHSAVAVYQTFRIAFGFVLTQGFYFQ